MIRTWLAALMVTQVWAVEYLVVERGDSAAGWKEVSAELARIHGGKVRTFDGQAESLLPVLKEEKPRFLAVVGAPSAFDAKFVRALNRVARAVDGDPYTDVRWGLITGATPGDGLKLVKTRDPLVIRRALTTTGIDLGLVDSGLTLSDGGKGGYTVKEQSAPPQDKMWDEKAQPEGTVTLFADAWAKASAPQLLVTSSHATQYNLEMPFGLGLIASYGGKFHVLSRQKLPEFARFLGGAMFTGDPVKLGEWLRDQRLPLLPGSDEPKVWVAAGNCLIGDAHASADSMVVTALGAGGVRQFVGYVVPTWFGRAGWGTLGLWQASRGGLSLSEAFVLNDHQLIEETRGRFPQALGVSFDSDEIQKALATRNGFTEGLAKLQNEGVKIEKDLLGLVHDRDVLALWGDPAWDARFDANRKPHALECAWSADGRELTIRAREDFEGTIARLLPRRFETAPAAETPDGWQGVVADDFLLFPKVSLKQGETRTIRLKPAA
jgi:zinc protease